MALTETAKEYDKFIIRYVIDSLKACQKEFGDIAAWHDTPRQSYATFPMFAMVFENDRIEDIGQRTHKHNAQYKIYLWIQSYSDKKNNAEWLYKKREDIKQFIDEHPSFAYTASADSSTKYPLIRAQIINQKVEFGTMIHQSYSLDTLEMTMMAEWMETLPVPSVADASIIRKGPEG